MVVLVAYGAVTGSFLLKFAQSGDRDVFVFGYFAIKAFESDDVIRIART